MRKFVIDCWNMKKAKIDELPYGPTVRHDLNQVERSKRTDDGDNNRDKCGGPELRHDDMPEHSKSLGAVQASCLDLLGINRRETGKIKNHAVGNLRP